MGLGIVSMSMLLILDQVVVEAVVEAGGEIVSSSIMYIYYNIMYFIFVFI